MKNLLCAFAALVPLTAWAYPIDLDRQLNGTEVTYVTDDLDPSMGSITLRNDGQSPVACSVIFANGPEAPKRRRASLAPGETANLVVHFNRTIIKLRIELECTP
ncbi:3-phosphoglycerate kinase [Pseudomonas mangiferae]|uniref:3-phosphoglycerate kinase n=1 Tax=Pseudomonas mangiferae TaxID=2593654 RepID=A0A553H2G1_9PSED|nr:3-phosphoglycerate kinase [Pseudomonas mangiferae]TRX75923.1 3-phosphoglycerate kinase [Pseudomonas mangiferae]